MTQILVGETNARVFRELMNTRREGSSGVRRASDFVIKLRDGGPAEVLIQFEYKESQKNKRQLCKMTGIPVRQPIEPRKLAPEFL